MENHAELSRSLRQVLRALQDTGLRYALAGGLAYSALVQPRATMDIDLLMLLDQTAFTKALRQLEQHFDVVVPHQEPMQFRSIRILRVVGYIGSKEVILDFLLAENEFHYSVLDRAIEVDFLECRLKVVTLEDLLLLKRCAHRPQDLVDIETIYALHRDSLDHDYLAHWAEALMLS